MEFKYADICFGKWKTYVYYYALNPATGKLERIRIFLNNIKNKTNRERMARNLVKTINGKLESGWNPFIDEFINTKKHTLCSEAFEFVLNYKNRFVRARTKTDYKHNVKELNEYLKLVNKEKAFIFEFNEAVATAFMNWLIMNRNISARTYNNNLLNYRTIFNTLVVNKYLAENPFKRIPKLPEADSTKRPFTDDELNKYIEYIKVYDFNFYIVSCLTYYCALRPQEIVRLKINCIDFARKVIIINSSQSKNKKNAFIPAPEKLMNDLKLFIDGYPDYFYLVTRKMCPGETATQPTRIAERFRVIANRINLPDEVKFYALKDTAAERLLKKGVDVKTIRDLFRHSNIAITDKYLKNFNPYMDDKIRDVFPEI